LRVHPNTCGLPGLHRAHRVVSTTSWVMSGHGAWVVADPGPHPHTLPWSRSPHPGRPPVLRSIPKDLPLDQRRLACGSSPLHRLLCRRPLPGTLARSLRADPTRVDSRSVLVVLHHLDGFTPATGSRFVAPWCRPWGSPRSPDGHRLSPTSRPAPRGASPFEGLLLVGSRAASRRSPCTSWRFEQHTVWTVCPALDGQRSLGGALSHLSGSAFASGTSLSPTMVFPPWTPPAAPRLSNGLLPPPGPDLGRSSDSMRTGSSMTLGLPPSHRSAPASTP